MTAIGRDHILLVVAWHNCNEFSERWNCHGVCWSNLQLTEQDELSSACCHWSCYFEEPNYQVHAVTGPATLKSRIIKCMLSLVLLLWRAQLSSACCHWSCYFEEPNYQVHAVTGPATLKSRDSFPQSKLSCNTSKLNCFVNHMHTHTSLFNYFTIVGEIL